MKLLDADNDVISWTKKHSIIIPYEWNGNRRYIPDFIVQKIETTIVEEIKGYEQPDKLETKMTALKLYCDEHDFEMAYIDSATLESMVKIHFGKSISTLRREHKKCLFDAAS